MSSSAVSLGGRIKELRLQKNLSMRALAQAANLRAVAYVSDLEHGYRHPSPEVLAALAQALDVPLAELRALDQRAPVQEIKDLTERDPAWAMAFRRALDAADAGMSPERFVEIIDRGARRK